MLILVSEVKNSSELKNSRVYWTR